MSLCRQLRSAAIAFALLLPAALQAEQIGLGVHGLLEIAVPETWSSSGNPIAEQGYIINIKPKTQANAGCKLTIMFVDPAKARPVDEMLESFSAKIGNFVAGSVEKSPEIKKLNLRQGFGWYATFTDARLVGKPPAPGNYKVMCPVMISLARDLVVAASIFTDDVTSAEFAEMIQLLETMKLTKAAR